MGRNSLLALLLLPQVAWTRNDDRFNYRETVGRDFGPEDWNRVTCDDVTQCVSSLFAWEHKCRMCGIGRLTQRSVVTTTHVVGMAR